MEQRNVPEKDKGCKVESKLTSHVVAGVDSIGGQDEVERAAQGLWGSFVHVPCLHANMLVDDAI